MKLIRKRRNEYALVFAASIGKDGADLMFDKIFRKNE